MLPVLTAEESLLAARRAAVGSGQMERHAAEGILAEWTREARLARPRAQKATPADLERLKIKRVVQRRVPPEA